MGRRLRFRYVCQQIRLKEADAEPCALTRRIGSEGIAQRVFDRGSSLPGNEDMTTSKHCPLCAIAEALPKLADLAGLIDQDNEKAHDLLKQTGDELTDVLDYFTEHAHENPFHPMQH